MTDEQDDSPFFATAKQIVTDAKRKAPPGFELVTCREMGVFLDPLTTSEMEMNRKCCLKPVTEEAWTAHIAERQKVWHADRERAERERELTSGIIRVRDDETIGEAEERSSIISTDLERK